MSLISKQIDELRAYAKDRKGELAKMVNDAADTIELLSAKLSAENLGQPSLHPNIACSGCRNIGTCDTDLPCRNCIRKERDYYEPEWGE